MLDEAIGRYLRLKGFYLAMLIINLILLVIAWK